MTVVATQPRDERWMSQTRYRDRTALTVGSRELAVDASIASLIQRQKSP